MQHILFVLRFFFPELHALLEPPYFFVYLLYNRFNENSGHYTTVPSGVVVSSLDSHRAVQGSNPITCQIINSWILREIQTVQRFFIS